MAPRSWATPSPVPVALKGIEIFERENYMEKIKKIEEISKREMLGFPTSASKRCA